MRRHPERILERKLKKHLCDFEPGMRLIATQFEHVWYEPYGKRFNRIDILARDSFGCDVLIEVKVRADIYSLNAQLKFYMEQWPKACRGIIAAKHFTKQLKSLSVALFPNIQLWEL